MTDPSNPNNPSKPSNVSAIGEGFVGVSLEEDQRRGVSVNRHLLEDQAKIMVITKQPNNPSNPIFNPNEYTHMTNIHIYIRIYISLLSKHIINPCPF